MALIKCIECENQISSFAESCPHCGCPARLQPEDVNANSTAPETINNDENFKYIRINGSDYDVTEAVKYIEDRELIKAVKVIKDVTGLGLKEAKEIADTLGEKGLSTKDFSFGDTSNTSVNITPEVICCPACKNQVSNQAQSCPHCGQPINTKPKCPHCGSQDIKKITGTERGLSVWAWGAFSNKINKNWKCNKCGHTW